MKTSPERLAQKKARYYANREMMLAKAKAAYDADPEKFRARSKAVYAANRESAIAAAKAIYWKDPKKHQAQHKQYRQANAALIKQRDAEKYIRRAEVVKADTKRWRLNNVARYKAIVARRNRFRRNIPGEHTEAEWMAICTKFRNRCAICRKAEKLERDHIVPVACGGTDYAFNIQPLCRTCNARKHAQIVTPIISLFDVCKT